MKSRQIFFAILMIGLISSSYASGDDVVGKWQKGSEFQGISVYSRETSKSSVYEIKATGTVDVALAAIEALIRDDAAKTEYSERCIEAFRVNLPGLKSTRDTYYSYHKIGMPWPFYNRDGVAKVECRINKETGALLIKAETIPTDFRAEDEYVLRVPIVEAKWILTPEGEKRTRAVYQILADPGGYLPAFVVNWISEDLAINTILGVRKMVKKDKYKNAKSVVTTTPW